MCKSVHSTEELATALMDVLGVGGKNDEDDASVKAVGDVGEQEMGEERGKMGGEAGVGEIVKQTGGKGEGKDKSSYRKRLGLRSSTQTLLKELSEVEKL